MSCQTWPEHHQSHSQRSQHCPGSLHSPHLILFPWPNMTHVWWTHGWNLGTDQPGHVCGSVLEWDNQWVVSGVLTWRVTLVTSWSPVTRVPQFPSQQQHFSPGPSASGWAVTPPDCPRTHNVTITPINPPLCNLTAPPRRDHTDSRVREAFSKKKVWKITHQK